VIVFRHTDPRFPFLWESAGQPGGRWNDPGEGPVNTFADTPEGAWAELLRHEEITDPADVLEIRRSLWAVEVGELPGARPRLPKATMTGGAHGWRVASGLRHGPRRDGRVIVLFGSRPELVGWEAVYEGRPSEKLLSRVRRLGRR
jgi:hypothetical protein